MLRLQILWALTLGALSQAFVTWPTHRLAVSKHSRGRSWEARHHWRAHGIKGGRSNRGSVPPSMRTARGRGQGGVQIEGAGGESHVVTHKRSRRPDLRAAQLIGIQAAAAAGVVTAEDEAMARLLEEAASWGSTQEGNAPGMDGEEAPAGGGGGGPDGALESSMLAAGDFGVVESEGEPQMYYDKYTKVFVPVDGVMVKKSYGFWTWQFFGFIFFQHWIRRMARKGFNIKKVAMGEINWDHVVTEPDHLKELKAYCCENCGYTLFPARGRHERFFVDDFRCPECDAPKSSFFDANDPDDPHNQEPEESEEESPEPSEEAVEELPPQIDAGMSEAPSAASPPEAEEDDEAPARTAPERPSEDGGDDLLDL